MSWAPRNADSPACLQVQLENALVGSGAVRSSCLCLDARVCVCVCVCVCVGDAREDDRDFRETLAQHRYVLICVRVCVCMGDIPCVTKTIIEREVAFLQFIGRMRRVAVWNMPSSLDRLSVQEAEVVPGPLAHLPGPCRTSKATSFPLVNSKLLWSNCAGTTARSSCCLCLAEQPSKLGILQ